MKLGNENLDVVQVYCPQQGRPDHKKENFYDMLQDTIDKMPCRSNLLVIGDINGIVRTD